MRTSSPAIVLLALLAGAACSPLVQYQPPPGSDPSALPDPPVEPAAAADTTGMPGITSEPAGPGEAATAGPALPPPEPAGPAEVDLMAEKPEQPDLWLVFIDGVVAHKAGRFDEALAHWESVWKQDRGFEDVEERLVGEYLVRGLEFFAEGGLDEAIRFWERAREIRPDESRVNAYLERAREQQASDVPTE